MGYCQIDPKAATKEELAAEIHRMEKEMWAKYNLQMALKILLNSTYGVIGTPHFVMYDTDIAEAITLQGQDVIHYAADMTDKYFLEKWHKDVKIHEKMGIEVTGQVLDSTISGGDTDSEIGTAKLNVEHLGDITFEDLWKLLTKQDGFEKDDKGYEVVKNPDIKTLNWDKDIYYADVKNLFRHKVTKERWKLTAKSGKSTIVTNDHSLVVFRNGKKTVVKPYEIKKDDKILTISKVEEDFEFEFEDIESCECVGMFEDEYVYDIETDGPTHTFIADEILVHNSIYVSVNKAIKSCDWKGSGREFCLQLYENRLKPYYKLIHDIYAKRWNTTNLHEFEMEAVSRTGIWLAKKKYVLNVSWTDGGSSTIDGTVRPGQFFDSGEKIKFTGIEIIKKSFPTIARDSLKEIVEYIILSGSEFKMVKLVRLLKKTKNKFKLSHINDISQLMTISDYEKHVANDQEIVRVRPRCPIHVRAAAIHNFYLNSHPKLKQKYDLIKSGNKVKYYYVHNAPRESENVFAFLPGIHPIEIAPEFDYDVNFEKTILKAVNRFMKALGKSEIPNNLTYMKPLF